MSKITMRSMLAAGIHFGHQTRFWNPKMAPYIFGVRHKIHIVNLDKTFPLYKDALNFIGKVAANNGKILFVGTKHSAQKIIREEAIRCGMPYVDYRWLGGMLTNYKTVRQSIKRLKDLEVLRDGKNFAGFTKKEALNITREITKLECSLGGIKNMGGLPDAIFIVDVGNEKIAVAEAKKLRIPIVGIVDTNNDPDGIDYVVPGNDDAIRAVKFYAQNMADSIIEARALLLEAQKAKAAAAAKAAPKVEKKEPTKRVTVKRKVVKTVDAEAKPAAEAAAPKPKAKLAKKEPAKKEAAPKKAEAAEKPKTVKKTVKVTKVKKAEPAKKKAEEKK